jgi:signal transduction histidine kinase
MRILIADDDEIILLVLAAAVRQLGHESITARDGNSAWELLQREPVDAVISDWLMPGMSGPELCRRLRARPDARYVYFILLTGLAERAQMLEGIEAGADDYLVKPLDADDLRLRLLVANRVAALHRSLAAGTAALQSSKEAADAAGRAKADFLANMSHEIRTPLNAVIGLTDIVLKEDLAPGQRDHLRRVRGAGRHLLGIVNDILDYSKIASGKLTVESRSFELGPVLVAALEMVADKARANGVRLTTRTDAAVPFWLQGDALRISQLLLNYLSNAVKYTENGSVNVDVAVVEQSGDGLLIRFAVNDTGIGMTEEQVGRMFQSFEQADASTTRKYGGTGLGLAICAKLAPLMGGAVGVNSQPGVGSEFWFTVRVKASAPADDSVQYGSTPDLAGVRILLVEDNDINQIVACEILGDTRASVTVEADGAAALARMATEHFDVVLMDVQMPVMDGLRCTKALRERGVGVPIIAMTASAMEEDRIQCREAGMDDFVGKPIEIPELWTVLNKWRPGAVARSART